MMNTKDENLLVKVVKKALGLPTGTSSCGCAPIASTANACCSTEASESSSEGCGCGGSAQEDEKRPAQA
jgi:hypothetical protein